MTKENLIPMFFIFLLILILSTPALAEIRNNRMSRGNNVGLTVTTMGLTPLQGIHQFPRGSNNYVPTYEGGWGYTMAVARDKDGDGIAEDTTYGAGRGRQIRGGIASLERYDDILSWYNAEKPMDLVSNLEENGSRVYSTLDPDDLADWPVEFRVGRTSGGEPVHYGWETISCLHQDCWIAGTTHGNMPMGVSFEYTFHFLDYGESNNMVYGHLFIRNMSEYLKWNNNEDFVNQGAATPDGQTWAGMCLTYVTNYLGIGSTPIRMDEGWALHPAKGIACVVDVDGMDDLTPSEAFIIGHKMLKYPSFNGETMSLTNQNNMRWQIEFGFNSAKDLLLQKESIVYRAHLGIAEDLYPDMMNPFNDKPAMGFPGMLDPEDARYNQWLWSSGGRMCYSCYSELHNLAPRDSTSCDFVLMFVYPANPPMVMPDRYIENINDPIMQEQLAPVEEHAEVAQMVFDNGYNLPEAPQPPPLTLTPGDGEITITWSNINLQIPDNFYYFLQDHSEFDPAGQYREFDFQGYRVYRSTTVNAEDAQLLAEFDLDTGLSFSYVDNEVNNGILYYYLVTAYDKNYLDNTEFSRESHLLFLEYNRVVPRSDIVIDCTLLGDVNLDETVDISDVVAIAGFALGKSVPSAQEFACADLNKDETVNIFDVLACVDQALGGVLLLAGVSEQNLSRVDLEKLKLDLSTLGADQSLIEDIDELFSQTQGKVELPKVFSLGQNFPNPFNPSTVITYRVPEGESAVVTLKVYDIRGRLVRTLVDWVCEPSTYGVFWDGRDEAGRQVSSGIYIYRMQAGRFVQARKMVLMK